MSLDESIQEFCDAYAEAFTRMDPSAVTALWSMPAFITAQARSTVFEDADEFERNNSMLIKFYVRHGVARAEKKLLSAMEVRPGVVFVKTLDTLFKSNHEVVVQWEHAYLLRSAQRRWKAMAAVADGEIDAWKARGTPLGGPGA